MLLNLSLSECIELEVSLGIWFWDGSAKACSKIARKVLNVLKERCKLNWICVLNLLFGAGIELKLWSLILRSLVVSRVNMWRPWNSFGLKTKTWVHFAMVLPISPSVNIKRKDLENIFGVKCKDFPIILSGKGKTWLIYRTLRVWKFSTMYEVFSSKYIVKLSKLCILSTKKALHELLERISNFKVDFPLTK